MGARTVVDVESLFLTVVGRRVAAKLLAEHRALDPPMNLLPRTAPARAFRPTCVGVSSRRRRTEPGAASRRWLSGRICAGAFDQQRISLSSPALEARRTPGAECRNPLGEVLGRGGQRAGERLDRRVGVFALGGVDH